MHLRWQNLLQEISRTFCRCVDAVSLSRWLICWMQCALPVFEGLLPEPYETIVMDLLFELATWHGLAKMRLHMESTIQSLEHSTMRLGTLLQRFQSMTCEAYITWELPSEEAACGRWKAAEAAKWSTGGEACVEELIGTVKKPKVNQRKFNLTTYKAHSLGDYVEAIRMYGTTDNHSTQLVRDSKLGQTLSLIMMRRVSWSIVEWRDSIHECTKANSPKESLSNSITTKFCTRCNVEHCHPLASWE
jgi:hypothetical protein